MNKNFKKAFSFILVLLMLMPQFRILGESADFSSAGTNADGIVCPVTFPSDSVKAIGNFDGAYSSVSEFINVASGDASYFANRGLSKGSLVISPDFENLTVNGESVPIYGTPVYVAETNRGAIQSFAMVDVLSNDDNTQVSIDTKFYVDSVAVHTPTGVIAPTVMRNGGNTTITATFNGYGNYIFVFSNNGNINQDYSFALSVHEFVDEEAEIADLQAEYGMDNVHVYEAGTHNLNYIWLQRSGVIYLRRGALLSINHTLDIDNESDNANKAESGANASNGWGMNRYPVITATNVNNIKIMGRGSIDGGKLDWHERRGIHISNCDGLTIEGINIINMPEWGITTYLCKNININNVMLFGYKTNSDGFALCNAKNATVKDCYARTGDDIFEVKTMGSGSTDDVSSDITFSNCIAWGSKARCYGITGEVERNISNVAFRDSKIIVRDATWDNSRIGGLAIIAENGSGNISKVSFVNIDILKDFGRAVNVAVFNSNGTNNIFNIDFKDITYNGNEKLRFASQNYGSVAAYLCNVQSSNTVLSAANASSYIDKSGNHTSCYFFSSSNLTEEDYTAPKESKITFNYNDNSRNENLFNASSIGEFSYWANGMTFTKSDSNGRLKIEGTFSSDTVIYDNVIALDPADYTLSVDFYGAYIPFGACVLEFFDINGNQLNPRIKADITSQNKTTSIIISASQATQCKRFKIWFWTAGGKLSVSDFVFTPKLTKNGTTANVLNIDKSGLSTSNGIVVENINNNQLRFNGSLPSGIADPIYLKVPFAPNEGDSYTFSSTYHSGTCSNGAPVLELRNSEMKTFSPRVYCDIYTSNQTHTITATSAMSYYTIHLWNSGGITLNDFIVTPCIEKGNAKTNANLFTNSVVYGSSMPTITPPARPGYTFDGFYDSPIMGMKYYNFDGSSAKNFDKQEDITLYAHWKTDGQIYSLKNGAVAGDGLLYGLRMNMTADSYAEYFNLAAGYSLEVTKAENGFGTGTKISIVNENDVVFEELYAVIFGDVNGDGHCDGMDSIIVSCIAENKYSTGEIDLVVLEAADCNFDGTIDEADSNLLVQSGLFLTAINQHKV